MNRLLFLFAAMVLHLQIYAQTSHPNLKKLEPAVQKVIQKAYQASVSIVIYDASRGAPGYGIFSGVVIDTAGHILSVAHAVKAGTLYQVTFPDGKKKLARGLGAIVPTDAAMLKITEKGDWPYVPMGWSSSLKAHMPCVSISYPATVNGKTPTIRFGYIAEPQTRAGFIRSTCLMEPGDSGGPVFDMEGRVIGLHSRIDVALDANFEVPVDVYRKYWNALTRKKNYSSLPIDNPFPSDPSAEELNVFQGIDQLSLGLNKSLGDKMTGNVFKLKSPYKNRKLTATVLGTLVNLEGLMDKNDLKNKSFLISKSSMLSDEVKAELGPDKFVNAKVIGRDTATDLALLQIEGELKGGIALKPVSADEVKLSGLGRLLASPRPGNNPLMSVMGNTQLNIVREQSDAYIGLKASSIGGKLVVAAVQAGGPAGNASVYQGDEVLTVNGRNVATEDEFNEEIDTYISTDTVTLGLLRNNRQIEKRVAVKSREQGAGEMHIAFKFPGGRSDRRTGFSNVMIHDGRLKPIECGGPLYGIDGRFYGINIARLSRTSSLAIPAAAIREFVRQTAGIKN